MSSFTDFLKNLFGKSHNGIYTGIVTDNKDPDKLGRVRVEIPQYVAQEIWARVATPLAGANRGFWFMPEVDDEVLVAFEGGDVQKPYLLGSLWRETALPPDANDQSGQNNTKLIRTRSGIQVTFYDETGDEAVSIQTPGGQAIVMQDGKDGSVQVSDANGNQIRLSSEGVQVTAASKVTVSASTVEISAGMVTVDSGMSKFSGVVQVETLIANSVISSSYTPGAGNVM